jgi:hypothetical protein
MKTYTNRRGKVSNRKSRKSKDGRKHKKQVIDGMTIYTLSGELYTTDDGTDLFRKYTDDIIELDIASSILIHPHSNIVSIYNVNYEEKYYDMEILDTSTREDKDLLSLRSAKDHLHDLGISYIDWKYDNSAVSKEGVTKLFDFNMCGMFDQKNNKWLEEPLHGYLYRYALRIFTSIRCISSPVKIDNFLFENMLFENRVGL